MCNSKSNHDNLQEKLNHGESCTENTIAKLIHA